MTPKPTIGDKIAYYALRTLEKPIGIMPTSWMWRIGAAIGNIAHKLAKKRKLIVQFNLKKINPDYSADQINTLSKEVFRKSFGNLISSINTGCIASNKLTTLVSFSGQENLRNLDPEKGAILLLFHMGNWEALSRLTPSFDTDKQVGAMFRPLNNPLINNHITKSREKEGSKLFARKRGLIQASKFIRDGNILAILADQHSGNAGIQLPLFGQETSITPLPTMLAQKYDCPIIPLTLSTTAPGKWAATFAPPITIPKDLDKTEATKLLVPILENVMTEHCSDIFWLHDRWKIKHSLKY